MACGNCGQELGPTFADFEVHFLESHENLLNDIEPSDVQAVIKSHYQNTISKQPEDVAPTASSSDARGPGQGPAQSESPRQPSPATPSVSSAEAEVSSVTAQLDSESMSQRESDSPIHNQSVQRTKSREGPRRSRARSGLIAVPGYRSRGRGGLGKSESTRVTQSRTAPSSPHQHGSRSPQAGSGASSRANRAARSSTSTHAGQRGQGSHRSSHPRDNPAVLVMVREPLTKPICHDQLVAEVKGIYAGLVMVESKCIEVDDAQSANASSENPQTLSNEQWQAILHLHRTLLFEHHDFFLASQHPAASLALKRLAAKYAMPARMWRHGIHSFLELLRHQLPDSLENMIAFVYLAYGMVALLYETVPAFKETWIECLGDLSRYRMAIEEDNMRDREIWTSVSRRWYSKALDQAPTTGRLYHHLAILARPNILQQLFYYSKSLCVPIPFASARESIMTLFEPVLSGHSSQQFPLDTSFVFVHGALFSGRGLDKVQEARDAFISGLDIFIARNSRLWSEPGYFIGTANSCAVVEFGNPSNPIFRAINPDRLVDSQDPPPDGILPPRCQTAIKFFCDTLRVVSRRFGDPSILGFMHVTMVFIYHLTLYPSAIAYVEKQLPWCLVSLYLNTLLAESEENARFHNDEFPRDDLRPLPEDFILRGLIWAERYLPIDLFSHVIMDDDEKYLEAPSMMEQRRVRILWIARQIAKQGQEQGEGRGQWLLYDEKAQQFGVTAEYDEDIDVDDLAIAEIGRVAEPVGTATPATPPETGDPMDTDDVDLVKQVPTIQD